MINFNIPGVYDHFELNSFIIHLYTENQKMFRDNVNISSVFGNFHFCIWDGGRNFLRYTQSTLQDIRDIKNLYSGNGIPIRFIFTNPEVTEEDLDDRFGNLLLDEFNTGTNEIVVNSPIMEQYLRENYPKYKLISSTTKRITDPNLMLEELNKDYYQVCLDYDLNKRMDILKSIPIEKREKCEFLVNAICRPGCPIRKWHYSVTGKAQLTYFRDGYGLSSFNGCTIRNNTTHPDIMLTGNNLSFEEIQEYNKLGFKYFKLEGRTLESSIVFAMYLYYLIKPEWIYHVIDRAANEPGIFYNDHNSSRTFEKIPTKIYTLQDSYLV